MPHPSEALRKVTLNLYDADVDYIQRTFGDGYTTVIREIVRDRVAGLKHVRGDK